MGKRRFLDDCMEKLKWVSAGPSFDRDHSNLNNH